MLKCHTVREMVKKLLQLLLSFWLENSRIYASILFSLTIKERMDNTYDYHIV